MADRASRASLPNTTQVAAPSYAHVTLRGEWDISTQPRLAEAFPLRLRLPRLADARDNHRALPRARRWQVRFLGDKVLQRQAWKVADQLGWETTYDAEYVALTKLQADVFVTSDGDLARAISGFVETASVDALSTT